MTDNTLRICLWSGPRNVSTAMMYAFAQRDDTTVMDEPLYGHYLATTGAEHPGREQVIAAMDTDGDRVVREQILGACRTPVLFCKQMAHHLRGLDEGFLPQVSHCLLTRAPEAVLTSLVHQIPQPDLADTGYDLQVWLLDELARQGRSAPVVDAHALLQQPRRVLSRLCEQLGIEFQPAMLSWAPGPREYDGVWAPWWYDNVHRSTGFAAPRPTPDSVPADLQPLLDQCRPLYDRLRALAIPAD